MLFDICDRYVRCGMNRFILVVWCMVWSSNILCELRWVFLKFFLYSLYGVALYSSDTGETMGDESCTMR